MRAARRRSSYDVVVVGAGVVGLACGWRAAQRGMSVLVLDRDHPAAGASGVAAGMLAPVTEAEFGAEALLALNLEGAARWPAFQRELADRCGTGVGYRESGALVVAIDRDDVEELRRLHAFQSTLGLAAEWLAARECRRLEPALAPGIAAGVFAPQDHQVDPRALTSALAIALERDGGELASGVEVRSITAHDGCVTGVRTVSSGDIFATNVVIAAGCWSGGVVGRAPEDVPPVRPVKGQILTLRGRSARPQFEHIVRTLRCYIVSRTDGRVAVGATVEERGFDSSVRVEGVHGLLEAAREVLPDVGELEFVGARAGLRPGTPDNGPLIGRGSLEGVVWATGHYRNGVLLAPLTADAVAETLVSGAPLAAVAAFSPSRFGPTRPALQPS